MEKLVWQNLGYEPFNGEFILYFKILDFSKTGFKTKKNKFLVIFNFLFYSFSKNIDVLIIENGAINKHKGECVIPNFLKINICIYHCTKVQAYFYERLWWWIILFLNSFFKRKKLTCIFQQNKDNHTTFL